MEQKKYYPTIKTDITLIEYNLLNFGRKFGYGRFVVEYMDGQPKKVIQPMKSFRFDLAPDGTPIAKLDAEAIGELINNIEPLDKI